MSNIDELFREIRETEISKTDISNEQGIMDEEMQRKIQKLVLKEIPNKKRKGLVKGSKKKFVTLILAAAFILSISVYAAQKQEWDIAIVNYMGIQNADTVQLEGGVVEINASSLSNGVTMTAVTSVGDKNSAYIRIDTDYKLPDSFQEETDYILTDDWKTGIYGEKSEISTGYGGSLQYFNNNGFLSFMMCISNGSGINQKKVDVSFTDLYLYHDLKQSVAEGAKDKTLLVKGTWDLSWKYHYCSNVDTYYPIKKVVSNKDTCFVTKIEISPITIRVEAIKDPKRGQTQTSMLLIRKVTMEDGSVITFDENSTSGGCKNNLFLDGYRDVMEMGKAIDPTKVYSITIGDTDIIL